ncbi:hypothetical protein DMC63_40680, partial [Streptomyces sp. WAC 05977]
MTAGVLWLQRQGRTLFALMEQGLRAALIERGVDPELLRFDFDHIEDAARGNSSSSIEIVVQETSKQPIEAYRAARSLDLFFLPRDKVLPWVHRRRLRWMVEGLARRVAGDSGDQSRLTLYLRSTKGMLQDRKDTVTSEVNAAVRQALPGAAADQIKTFIDQRIEFVQEVSLKSTALFARLTEPGLVPAPASTALSAGGLVALPAATAVDRPSWGADAYNQIVDDWWAGLPAVGEIRWSPEDEWKLGALVDRIARTSAELERDGREPADVRLHLTDTPARRARLGPRLFESLAGRLREAMRAQGMDVDAERFPFDRLQSSVPKDAMPSIAITVHLSPNRPATNYRAARKLQVPFFAHSAEISQASRRRLRWLVEGFAARVRDNADPGKPSRLLIELRCTEKGSEERVSTITAVVNEAVRAALPDASDEMIKRFIEGHIGLARSTWRKSPMFLLDIEGPEHALDDSGDRQLARSSSGGTRVSGAESATRPAEHPPATEMASEQPVRGWEPALLEEHMDFEHTYVEQREEPGRDVSAEPVHEDLGAAESSRDAPVPPATEGAVRFGEPIPDDPDMALSVEGSESSENDVPVIPLPASARPLLHNTRPGIETLENAPLVGRWAVPADRDNPMSLSEADQASLADLAENLVGELSLLPGQEPWDVRLHVHDNVYWLKNHAEALFDLMDRSLRTALLDRGVDPELLRFEFDRVEHTVIQKPRRGLSITVHRTPNRSVQSYRDASSLALSFLPRGKALFAAESRRLRWMVGGLVQRVTENGSDPSRLVLELRSTTTARAHLAGIVADEVNAAVWSSLPEATAETVKKFIEERIEYLQGPSRAHTVVFADLIDAGTTEAPPPAPAPMIGLVALPAEAGAPREQAGSSAPDAVVETRWRAELPATGEPRLSPEDEASLAVLTDRIARNAAELERNGREPADVRLNLADTAERRARFGPSLFGLLEGRLREAMRAHGVDADAARFTFDRLHGAVPKNGTPGVEVTVHRSPNRPVRGYQAARSLRVPFLARDSAFSRAALRRLEWLIEGLAERVRDNADPVRRPRLILDLRSTEHWITVRKATVTVAVNAAVRAALPDAPEEAIKQFVEEHITFRQEVSPSYGWLYSEIEGPEHALDSVTARPEPSEAPLPEPPDAGRDESLIALPLAPVPPSRDSAAGGAAAADAPEERSWSAKVTKTDPPGLSPEDQASLTELADSVARETAASARREPPDVRLHVFDTSQRRRRFATALFDMLEEKLSSLLEQRGVARDALRFAVDRIEHELREGESPWVRFAVHRSPHRTVRSYQASRRLDLPFPPRSSGLSQASRRRLGWLVEGLAERARDNAQPDDRPRLVLDLRSSETVLPRRLNAITIEMNAAVRAVLPDATWEEAEQFIKDHVGLRQTIGPNNPMLRMEITGPDHFLDSERESTSEQGAPVEHDGSASRTGLVPLPAATADAPIRSAAAQKAATGAAVEAAWRGTLSGDSLVLSPETEAELNALLDHIARNAAELTRLGLEPLDIRLQVMDTPVRLKQRAPELFDSLEERVRAALRDRGAALEESQLPFDRMQHTISEGQPARVGVSVYRSPNRSRRAYRAERELVLAFLPRSDRLPQVSLRRLGWLMEGLVERVRDAGDSGQRVRLNLELHAGNRFPQAREFAVLRAVNAAVRAAMPSAQEEEIQRFIEGHLAFRQNSQESKATVLYLDVEGPEHILDQTSAESGHELSWPALPWLLKKLSEDKSKLAFDGDFSVANERSVKMFADDEDKLIALGLSLGQRILAQAQGTEYPDVRILSEIRAKSGDAVVRRAMRDYLTNLLNAGMRGAGMAESAVQKLDITWSWRKGGRGFDGHTAVRVHLTPGKTPEQYRQSRVFTSPLHRSQTQIPVAVENRLTWVVEGFFDRFAAASGARPGLHIDITGSSKVGPDRQTRVEELVREALLSRRERSSGRWGLPSVDEIMREHVRIFWDAELQLPGKMGLSVRESVPGEDGVPEASPEVAVVESPAPEGGVTPEPEVVVSGSLPGSPEAGGSLPDAPETAGGVPSEARAEWESQVARAREASRAAREGEEPDGRRVPDPAEEASGERLPESSAQWSWEEQETAWGTGVEPFGGMQEWGAEPNDGSWAGGFDPEIFTSMGFDPADFAGLAEVFGFPSGEVASGVGSVGDPVLLSDVVGVGLEEVDFVALR